MVSDHMTRTSLIGEEAQVIDIRGIGYFGLNVTNVNEWTDFATSVVGLEPVYEQAIPTQVMDGTIPTWQPTKGVRYLKVDEHQWSIALQENEQSGMAYVGFELSSARAFEDAAAHLAAEGFMSTPATPEELNARGVRGMRHLKDPAGTRVELYWGPLSDGEITTPPLVGRFVTGESGLGHFVLFVSDLAATMDFYQRGLGLRLSDYTVIGPHISINFLRCNPRHHSVAVAGPMPFNTLQHIALEMQDIDHVGRALDRAKDAD